MIQLSVVKHAVRLACRAPSLHNTQPWRWVARRDGLHLYLDRTRVMGATDAAGREALISCGAVLHHLRVAVAAAGWDGVVTRFPDGEHADHLAAVRFRPTDVVEPCRRRLADAILVRRTDRLPFAAPPDWDTVHARLLGLLDALGLPGVHLDVIAEADHPRLVAAAALADASRLDDTRYQLELHWWTTDFVFTEGIPRSALVTAAEGRRVAVGRTFPAAAGRERRGELSDDRAVITVLSTADDGPAAALHCGEALSAVLLEATAAGLSTCTLSHLTEVPESRAEVADLIGGDSRPQVLVRIGRAPALEGAPAPTPRRPLDDVLDIDPEPTGVARPSGEHW